MTLKMQILLKDELCRPEQHGDLCDLKFSSKHIDGISSAHMYRTINYKKGEIFKVRLGFSAKMPDGYHANVFPRSSTRERFGVLLTNSVGNIDGKYCGESDEWMAEFLAIEDGYMAQGDRILQFKLVKNEPKTEFEFVESLEFENRGGYGSTGK